MKYYLLAIRYLQRMLLWSSILLLALLPPMIALFPTRLPQTLTTHLYDISHLALFVVMIIRPLADLLPTNPWIRPLVILRKGLGVVSASIIVSFILAKMIVDPTGYLGDILTPAYWSWNHYALLAHLGDLTAIILLITSNTYSKRLLGHLWKKIQKLSYVYFYASSLYVFLLFGKTSMVVSLTTVTVLTFLAYQHNRTRRLTAFAASTL